MKKKRGIDLSHIRITASDTDDEIMVKVRQAMPQIVRALARQAGEIQWASMARELRNTGLKNDPSERAKFVRDTGVEYLRGLRAPEKQEIALQVAEELKSKRDLLAGK